MIKSLSDIGIAGIATLLILYHFWKDKMYNKTINNHLEHINQTLINNITALNKMTDSQKLLGKIIEDNTRVMNRVENVLDKRI